MKYLLLLLIFISACGGPIPPGSGLGESRSISPQALDSSDIDSLTSICLALQQKAVFLNQGSNNTYVYNVAQRGCNDAVFGPEGEETVAIQRESGNFFIYKRVLDNKDFIFRDVETHNSGTLGEICTKFPDITNPLVLTNGRALWFTSRTNSDDCSPDPSSRCLMVETGIGNGEVFKISSRDWFKIQIDPNLPRLGFYIDRKNISFALCGSSKTTEARATLKQP